MSTTDPSPRRRRKEARPQELLDAALELFVEKGFAATRAEEVAVRAGVSKGTLYLYFQSKEDLLRAVITHNLSERIAEGAAQVAAFSGSASELLRVVLCEWWEHIYNSPAGAVFKLVITEVRNFPEISEFYIHEVVEPAHHLLGGIVQRGIAQGEFRPVDVDVAVHSLVLPLIMICVHKHSIGACGMGEQHSLDGNAFIRQHVQLVLDGLCQPATRQPTDDTPP
ncbi:TetR/AcrR family transcriptional regulator [Aquabacterium sp.]|uniref:TetR/AcrR family transcriptional regulator n=1 Tax=Aquabacterium sp. TaxID=1872578 RepID=UPI002C477A2E|nr:TetR/AcrR family transcriptional regulator [Aquabacterium sp.]HSW07364.1 TetR/AcrR family transcriptional regulator [Aquabacterium sp.]